MEGAVAAVSGRLVIAAGLCTLGNREYADDGYYAVDYKNSGYYLQPQRAAAGVVILSPA